MATQSTECQRRASDFHIFLVRKCVSSSCQKVRSSKNPLCDPFQFYSINRAINFSDFLHNTFISDGKNSIDFGVRKSPKSPPLRSTQPFTEDGSLRHDKIGSRSANRKSQFIYTYTESSGMPRIFPYSVTMGNPGLKTYTFVSPSMKESYFIQEVFNIKRFANYKLFGIIGDFRAKPNVNFPIRPCPLGQTTEPSIFQCRAKYVSGTI